MRSVYEPVRRHARLERVPVRVRLAWRRLAGRLVLAALAGSLAVLGACGWYLRADLAYDPDNLIRLHVVANSDAPADQALKLEVRDAILSTSGELFAVRAPEDAAALVKANLPLFERVAREVLRAGGYDYPVAVEFGRYWFPERSYGPLLLPAGEYQALRVVIGDGRGANWWCILFPPLCYLDVVGGNRETVWGITPSGNLAVASGAAPADGTSRVLPLTSLTEAQLRDLEVILSRALDNLGDDARATGLSEADPATIGDGQLRVIITDVPTDDDSGLVILVADAGEDKMEKMAAEKAQSIWDIARHYTQAYWADIKALNIREPAHWSIATDYVPQMIDFAKSIADEHCYELESGLYFDTSTVANYGALARARTEDGEGRIEEVEGKRHAADFAIWRKTPAGETRQMEWDSPWGKGAPGWHLECSVMSEALLGLPFDIHTGGIDHREIHHPNEIAQNQARCGSDHSGARFWMHNNFLIERSGKMSKSSGEFLRVQLLKDKGFHPLAYRLMCLQAHYRSELEFSWEGLQAALVR
ncbi:MAG: stage II sporulation protein R, partial [Dehalococcoidia bacterium]|nr:stage II sporulation protein R [Dehalococcoidia bacterium]